MGETARSGIKSFIVHKDNLSPHTTHPIVDFLIKQKLKCMGHPPYSPDLALCDFYMFPKAVDELRGRMFQSSKTAVEEYISVVEEWSQEAYTEACQKWFRRLKLCVECSGEYFEKL